jgi:hypothetical protein
LGSTSTTAGWSSGAVLGDQRPACSAAGKSFMGAPAGGVLILQSRCRPPRFVVGIAVRPLLAMKVFAFALPPRGGLRLREWPLCETNASGRAVKYLQRRPEGTPVPKTPPGRTTTPSPECGRRCTFSRHSLRNVAGYQSRHTEPLELIFSALVDHDGAWNVCFERY